MEPAGIRNALLDAGALGDQIRGCSEAEIRAFEQQQGLVLPVAFRAFLRAVGRHAGGFLVRTQAFFYDLEELTRDACDLLVENGYADCLPADAFFFYIHQGYEFGYFRLCDGPDPAVYQVYEGVGRRIWRGQVLRTIAHA